MIARPFKFGEILLPKNINVYNRAVVACDEHTSNPAYWNNLENELVDPTSLKIIFPECYLSDDKSDRIENIITKQNEYLGTGHFRNAKRYRAGKASDSMRQRAVGLMYLLNLSDYCSDGKTRSAIRATEGLVESRIPPRKAIRENCPIEFPHIMLLIDDPRRTVIEPLNDKGKVVYDGDLNSDGGKITGYDITDVDGVTSALDALYDASTGKYGEPLLFLVGDGNHSLATAKACVDGNNPLSRYAS